MELALVTGMKLLSFLHAVSGSGIPGKLSHSQGMWCACWAASQRFVRKRPGTWCGVLKVEKSMQRSQLCESRIEHVRTSCGRPLCHRSLALLCRGTISQRAYALLGVSISLHASVLTCLQDAHKMRSIAFFFYAPNAARCSPRRR